MRPNTGVSAAAQITGPASDLPLDEKAIPGISSCKFGRICH